MKNIRLILLAFVCCIGMFCFVPKGHAEKAILLQECEYSKSYPTTSSDRIYIGYTQLKPAKEDRFAIKARTDRTNDFEDVEDFDKYFGVKVVDDLKNNATYSVASTLEGCPKYMTLESVKENKKFTTLFYNDLNKSAECNGTPSSKCNSYYTLVKTRNNVIVDTTEDYWTLGTAIDTEYDSCSQLTIDLTVRDNKLYGKGTYGRQSHYYSKATNWTESKVVEDVKFMDVYKLAVANTLTQGITFNSEKNIFVGSNKTTGKRCSVTSNFNKGKICVDSIQLSTRFREIENIITKAYPDISSIYTRYTVKSSDGTTRIADTFEDIKFEENLDNAIEAINDTINKSTGDIEAIRDELTKIKNGTYRTSDGKAPCQNAKDEAARILENLTATHEDYSKKITVLEESINNAMARYKEISTNEARTEELKEIVDEVSETVKKYNNITALLKASMLEGMKFDFKALSGCAMFSDDMKSFLNTVLWYIRIAGVVLAVILSLVDYIKAASGSDDKSMASANKKVLMRLVFVAILFLVPALLEFVLKILNISTTAGSLNCIK